MEGKAGEEDDHDKQGPADPYLKLSKISVKDEPIYKKAFHPFVCRLDDTAAFNVKSARSLIGAGFASYAVGFLTIFRFTPAIMIIMATRLKETKQSAANYKLIFTYAPMAWLGTVLFILFVLGLIPLLSVKIKKRFFLLIHPWALLLLYLDGLVWLVLVLLMHLHIASAEEKHQDIFDNLYNAPTYLCIMYVDTFIYWAGYCLYATYFITAELTVIERFF